MLPIDLPTLLDHERRVWQALIDGDAAADERLLDERFVGVYPTGFATRADHVAQLADGPRVSEVRLDQARVVVVRPDVALLSYLATFRRAGAAADLPAERMYVSSLWHAGPDGWRNLFSQDTPAA